MLAQNEMTQKNVGEQVQHKTHTNSQKFGDTYSCNVFFFIFTPLNIGDTYRRHPIYDQYVWKYGVKKILLNKPECFNM